MFYLLSKNIDLVLSKSLSNMFILRRNMHKGYALSTNKFQSTIYIEYKSNNNKKNTLN